MLWAKGYTELLQRLSEHAQRTGEYVPVDVYGGGPDLKVSRGVMRGERGGGGRERRALWLGGGEYVPVDAYGGGPDLKVGHGGRGRGRGRGGAEV